MAERDVLIVDDNRPVRDVLCQVLLAAGYNCLPASDGNEALEVLRQSRPPLIVTELVLPHRLPTSVMAGFELLKQIRREDPDAAVIVLSHGPHFRTLIECLKHGASAYLIQPVNVEELVITAERALERRGLLIERRQYAQAGGQGREADRRAALAQRAAPILIVEEDAGVCRAFHEILLLAGHKCVVASDWEQGRAAFLESRPGLVIVDLAMPMARGGDRVRDAGIRLLLEIRLEDPDAAVIVASGTPDVKPVIESLKLGAYAFLTKPIVVDELVITVERALEHRELLIERRRRGGDRKGA
jgi:DNA-binding NtrC family response regulator